MSTTFHVVAGLADYKCTNPTTPASVGTVIFKKARVQIDTLLIRHSSTTSDVTDSRHQVSFEASWPQSGMDLVRSRGRAKPKSELLAQRDFSSPLKRLNLSNELQS